MLTAAQIQTMLDAEVVRYQKTLEAIAIATREGDTSLEFPDPTKMLANIERLNNMLAAASGKSFKQIREDSRL